MGKKMSVSKRTLRVLHVLDHLSPASGVASVVMNCINGISHIHQDIAIYGHCDSRMEAAIRSSNGKVYKLPYVTKSFGWHFSKAFTNLLQEQQYSIIHGHLMNSAFIYLRIANKLGIPHRIIHAHSSISADTMPKRIRNDMLSRPILLYANKLIAVSHMAAENAFGDRASDATIIHNGIDTDKFRFRPIVRQEMRNELGLTDDVLCIGHVARLAESKNQGFLLDVFHEMQRQAKCILVIAGNGPLEGSLKEKANMLGLSKNVKFLRMRSDTERLYQAFDVFLLPSLSEGFGLAAVEAQCAGVSCMVSEFVPRVIRCGKRIRFLPLDALIWADTAIEMSKLIRDDGATCVEAAMLNLESMCVEVLKIYESCLTNQDTRVYQNV